MKFEKNYSELAVAKLREDLVLKNGVVFNNDYEGSPCNGSVKIPVRDVEVSVSDYDRSGGLTSASNSTYYETMLINKDKAVNEIIDGFDSSCVPDDLVAERIDSASYSLSRQMDKDGAETLIEDSEKTSTFALTKDNIYQAIVNLRTKMSKNNVPNDSKRYLLVTSDVMALILNAPEFIRASSLGENLIQDGVQGKIAGFKVIEFNSDHDNLAMIAGHPRFATRAQAFKVPLAICDLSSSDNYIGASALKGRSVYDHKVLRSSAIISAYAPNPLLISRVGQDKLAVVNDVEDAVFEYKVNPIKLAEFGSTYDGDTFASGVTSVTYTDNDLVEIAQIVDDKVVAVGIFNC